MSAYARTESEPARASSERRRLRGIRIFSSIADAPRARRGTDILMLCATLATLFVLAWPAPGPTAVDDDLTTFLHHLPDVLDPLWQIGFAALALWPIILVLIVLASRGRRSLLLDWLVAAALAAALSLGIGGLAGTPISESLRSLASTGPPQVYVAVRLALATAVVATASPHLSLPLRRIGRGVLLLGAVSAIALDVAFALGAAAGFLVGLGVLVFAVRRPGRPAPANVTALRTGTGG